MGLHSCVDYYNDVALEFNANLGCFISSHIFCEGNCCADRLTMGHAIQGFVWLDTLTTEVQMDFFCDNVGLPNYRFPFSVVVCLHIFFVYSLPRVLA